MKHLEKLAFVKEAFTLVELLAALGIPAAAHVGTKLNQEDDQSYLGSLGQLTATGAAGSGAGYGAYKGGEKLLASDLADKKLVTPLLDKLWDSSEADYFRANPQTDFLDVDEMNKFKPSLKTRGLGALLKGLGHAPKGLGALAGVGTAAGTYSLLEPEDSSISGRIGNMFT
jgi:hypothetical protein